MMLTVKEFDYNLWTTEENRKKRYWVRIKATGEVTEVNQEVMRVLRCEEKRLVREIETQTEEGTVLSLDYASEDEVADHWLTDSYQLSEDVATNLLERDFEKLLTPFQREIYHCCMKNGMKCSRFAKLHFLDSSTVYEAREAVRKKFKKYFC